MKKGSCVCDNALLPFQIALMQQIYPFYVFFSLESKTQTFLKMKWCAKILENSLTGKNT